MSSKVTRPRTLPNSSTTMAKPTWCVRNSTSNSLAGLVSGTMSTSRSTRRRSKGEAENLILGAAVYGNARTLRRGEGSQDFIQGGFRGDGVHIRPGHHDFAYLHLPQLDCADDELLFPGRQKSPLTCLLNLNLQLFRGMCCARNLWLGYAKGLHDRTGDTLQKIDGPAKRF